MTGAHHHAWLSLFLKVDPYILQQTCRVPLGWAGLSWADQRAIPCCFKLRTPVAFEPVILKTAGRAKSAAAGFHLLSEWSGCRRDSRGCVPCAPPCPISQSSGLILGPTWGPAQLCDPEAAAAEMGTWAWVAPTLAVSGAKQALLPTTSPGPSIKRPLPPPETPNFWQTLFSFLGTDR